MSHAVLPREISPNRAALLLGRSRRAVNRLIETGLLSAEGRVHARIPMASVEAVLGREITLNDWASAEGSAEQGRRTQALYNATRKGTHARFLEHVIL